LQGTTDDPPRDSHGHPYLVAGQTYDFVITNIEDWGANPPDYLTIKIGYKDITSLLPDHAATDWIGKYPNPGVALVDGTATFSWTVPDTAMFCQTGTVHYMAYNTNAPQYLADGYFTGLPSSFHVIPENYLGSIGALGAGALALVAFITIKRRAIRLPYIKFK
jgi:hypothetical protein